MLYRAICPGPAPPTTCFADRRNLVHIYRITPRRNGINRSEIILLFPIVVRRGAACTSVQCTMRKKKKSSRAPNTDGPRTLFRLVPRRRRRPVWTAYSWAYNKIHVFIYVYMYISSRPVCRLVTGSARVVATPKKYSILYCFPVRRLRPLVLESSPPPSVPDTRRPGGAEVDSSGDDNRRTLRPGRVVVPTPRIVHRLRYPHLPSKSF